MKRRPAARPPGPQHGAAIVVVLVLLSVMLLGGLALARMAEVRTVAAGNAAWRDAAVHASEAGLNQAMAALLAPGFNEEADAVAGGYFATRRGTDAAGVPLVDWNAAPEVALGPHRVRYVIDRLCETAPVTNALQQCLVRQAPQTGSTRAGVEALDAPQVRQFRITVRVLGPRDAQAWVQALATRG